MERRKPLALLVMLVASLVLAAAGVSAAEHMGLIRLTSAGSVPIDPCRLGAPECHPRPGADPEEPAGDPGTAERAEACRAAATGPGPVLDACLSAPRAHGLLTALRHLAMNEVRRAAKEASKLEHQKSPEGEREGRGRPHGEEKRGPKPAQRHGPKPGRSAEH